MTEYIIQEVDTFLLIEALSPEFSVDAAYTVWDAEEERYVSTFTDPAELLDRKIDEVLFGGYGESFIESILAGDQFCPIVVGVNGWNDYGDVQGWMVGNGNHRLATIIAGMVETVLVVFTESRHDFMVGSIYGG